MTRRRPWSALFALPLLACGGEMILDYQTEATTPNTVTAEAYPAGPYGTKVNDVSKNLEFAQAFLDPMTACKPADKLDAQSVRGIQPVSLDDLRQQNPFCPGKRKHFLYVISSAGW